MRIRRLIVAIAVPVLLALTGLALVYRQQHAREFAFDGKQASIVFVCRNGVAMSVWSALTFDRLASERGLPLRASSRAAASSFTEVPLRMKLALALDGYRVSGYRPQVISAADIHGAERVILIDTDLPPSVSAPGAAIETWQGFPPMREQYFASRAALYTRVEELVARLAASAESSR